MNQYIVSFISEGKTSDLELLKKRLSVLLEQDVLAPNYWGSDERKRLPWSVDDIVAYCMHQKDMQSDFVMTYINLWSTKAPRYVGQLYVSEASVNTFEVEFSPPSSTRNLQRIYEAAEEVAKEFDVIFGHVHPISPGSDFDVEGLDTVKRANLFWGLGASDSDIRKRGLASVLARTWFGPSLAERVGRQRLHSAGIAKEYPSGMVRLDLVQEPWTATLTELAARKAEAMRVLQPSGMFVEVEFEDTGGPYAKCTRLIPAPKWMCPDWILSPHDINRKPDHVKGTIS